MDVLFYKNGWRYARLLSHDGRTALVVHPVEGKKHVKLEDVKVCRLEDQSKLKEYYHEETRQTDRRSGNSRRRP